MMRETPLGNLGNRVKNRIYTVYCIRVSDSVAIGVWLRYADGM